MKKLRYWRPILIALVILLIAGIGELALRTGSYFPWDEAKAYALTADPNPVRAKDNGKDIANGVTKVTGCIKGIQRDCIVLGDRVSVFCYLRPSDIRQLNVGDTVEVWGFCRYFDSDSYFMGAIPFVTSGSCYLKYIY